MVDISIICPVYKTDLQLLKNMLESITAQTYSDYELLIVDDGNDDDYAKILDEIVTEDKRFIVLHKENGGVSSARNVGINNARGKYIAFVDGDDYIYPKYLEEAMRLATKYNADVVCGTLEYYPQNNNVSQKTDSLVDIIERPQIDSAKASLLGYLDGTYNYQILGSPCAKLYTKEVVPFFEEEVRYFEDQLFNREVFNRAKRIAVCNNCWYRYIQHEQSAMHNAKVTVDYYAKVKPYWDCVYKLNQGESDYIKHIARKDALNHLIRMANIGYVMNNVDEKQAVAALKTAANHELIQDAISNLASNDSILSINDKVKLFLIKHRMMGLFYKIVKGRYRSR